MLEVVVQAANVNVTAKAAPTVDAWIETIAAAAAGAAGSAALSVGDQVLDNRVAMQVDAFVEGKLVNGDGIKAGGVTIRAEDTALITAKGWNVTAAASGGIGSGSLAVGVAISDNLVDNDVQAWARNTQIHTTGDLSITASDQPTIDASAHAVTATAAFSIGFALSGGGANTSSTVEGSVGASVDASHLAVDGDLNVAATGAPDARARVDTETAAGALLGIAASGSVTDVTITPTITAEISASTVQADGVTITATSTPYGHAYSDALTISVSGGAVGVSKATTTVSPTVTAMAIAWGDAWTNMIQPFWALPLLGIVGLGARDIMGYCLMMLLYSGVVICGAFYFLT